MSGGGNSCVSSERSSSIKQGVKCVFSVGSRSWWSNVGKQGLASSMMQGRVVTQIWCDRHGIKRLGAIDFEVCCV